MRSFVVFIWTAISTLRSRAAPVVSTGRMMREYRTRTALALLFAFVPASAALIDWSIITFGFARSLATWLMWPVPGLKDTEIRCFNRSGGYHGKATDSQWGVQARGGEADPGARGDDGAALKVSRKAPPDAFLSHPIKRRRLKSWGSAFDLSDRQCLFDQIRPTRCADATACLTVAPP